MPNVRETIGQVLDSKIWGFVPKRRFSHIEGEMSACVGAPQSPVGKMGSREFGEIDRP
jgi:hypothetical protein